MRNTLNAIFTRTVLVLALLACLAHTGGAAVADTLHLKDGRVIEGRVEMETDSFVYFIIKVGSIERGEYFLKEVIDRIERTETPAKSEPAKPGASDRTTTDARAPSDGAVRVAFITLGEPGRDTVGLFMNAEALKHSFDLLEKDKPDIVVLLINSGGGALVEIQKLSDVIEDHFKKNYRTVAWIHSAISAAAMTAVTCNEIYFMTKGNLGAATGYRMVGPGRAEPVSGEMLEHVLYMMEKISARGGYNPLVMRAMQVYTDLSCDIDENGVVHWRNDLDGQYIVNTKDRILTFNSRDAMLYKFARGIADTKQELLQLLIGDQEWVEVGQQAGAYQYEYRETTERASNAVNELYFKYSTAKERAQRGRDGTERTMQVGVARRHLGELRSYARRSAGIAFYFGLSDDWFKQEEEELRRLAAAGRAGR